MLLQGVANNISGHFQGPLSGMLPPPVVDTDADVAAPEVPSTVPGARIDYDEFLSSLSSGRATVEEIDRVLFSERVITVEQMQAALGVATNGPCRKTRENCEYAWRQYESFCEARGHAVSNWPPPCDVWTAFLTLLRGSTNSASVFSSVYNRVATVGKRLYGGETPYHLYRDAHLRCLKILNRHYGESVKQVAGITTTEARNFHKFVSKDDIAGLLSGTAFSFGLSSGGKRARSAVAIQLKDVVVSVCTVKVRGVATLVPQLRLRLRDEKVMDSQGARRAGEWLAGMEDYHIWGERTFSWWAYRLLVMRNAFSVFDPMRTARPRDGEVLCFRDDAKLWFLFCFCRGILFVNTVPASTRTMSTMTRSVLQNMGCDRRGWSAHRKGGVTRAMQRELLKSKGKEISNAFELALLRWGGWDIENGLKTMRRRYIQGVLDDHLHTVGLALGVDMSDEEHAIKTAEAEGEELEAPPAAAIAAVKLPYALQLMIYHEPGYVLYQSRLDAKGLAVVSHSRADDSIALADREAAVSDLFADVLRRYPDIPPVRAWLSMRCGQWRAFQCACALAKQMVQSNFDVVFGKGSSKKVKIVGVMESLLPYEFGGMPSQVVCPPERHPGVPPFAYRNVPIVFCATPPLLS